MVVTEGQLPVMMAHCFTHPCAQHFIPTKTSKQSSCSTCSYKIYMNFSAPGSTQLCPLRFILFLASVSFWLPISYSFVLILVPFSTPLWQAFLYLVLCLLCFISFFLILLSPCLIRCDSTCILLSQSVCSCIVSNTTQYYHQFSSNPYLSFIIQSTIVLCIFSSHPHPPFLFDVEMKPNMLSFTSERGKKYHIY